MYEITMYLLCLLTWFHNFSVYSISGTYVPNWSISRNYKNIWNSTKNSVTIGMFVARRPRGAKPQVKGTQGPAGRPTSWLAGHTLSRFRPRHGAYAPKAVCKSIQCPKVGGNWEEWLADHVDDHPAVHHL
jgi:hypothetical protein